MVVVAIRISLALKLFDYNKYRFCGRKSENEYDILMPQGSQRSLCGPAGRGEVRRISSGGLAKRGYNLRVGASSGVPRRSGGEPSGRAGVPRWLMSLIEIVGGIFGLFAVGLIVLLIYRSTLTMHEDDQLFLDEANSHMQEEQTQLLTKVNRLTLPVRVFSIGSGVFLLAFLAMLIYQKLSEVQ
jgi:hypothetical protein